MANGKILQHQRADIFRKSLEQVEAVRFGKIGYSIDQRGVVNGIGQVVATAGGEQIAKQFKANSTRLFILTLPILDPDIYGTLNACNDDPI